LNKKFSVGIKIIANDQPGLLANLASLITAEETNISSVQTNETETGIMEFIIDIQVNNRLHLSKIIRRLKTLKSLISVNRIHDQEMRNATILH
jgi:GTP pyrophosphokinase